MVEENMREKQAAATQAMGTGFTVTLVDGTAFRASKVDHVFSDGLSAIVRGYRRYFPLTAIREIMMTRCPSFSTRASPPQPAWTDGRLD